MTEVELDLPKHLISELKDKNIPGDMVEFGVFEGKWLAALADINEEIGRRRAIYGFDSFEGLPALSDADEGMGWHQGMFEVSLEAVQANLRTNERPYIKLIKG